MHSRRARIADPSLSAKSGCDERHAGVRNEHFPCQDFPINRLRERILREQKRQIRLRAGAPPPDVAPYAHNRLVTDKSLNRRLGFA
jgi:hypothetical protein